MNKKMLSVIAIGSLSTLCCAMFNSHMPATNQIAREMQERMMRDAEQRRREQQEQYFNQRMQEQQRLAQQQQQQQNK
jgi:hypothetical protein